MENCTTTINDTRFILFFLIYDSEAPETYFFLDSVQQFQPQTIAPK